VSVFAVINPASDNRGTRKRWPRILSALKEKMGNIEWRFTERPGHATEVVREALRAGENMIISVGGDGTNNEVVNGFFDAGRLINDKAVLCLLPSGTACDFAKALCIRKNIQAAVDVISDGSAKVCDLGKATFRGHDGQTVERYFLNVTDLGIGGETVARVNRSTKALGPFVSYLYGFIATLIKYENKLVRVVVDDKDLGDNLLKAVAIANGKCCGGGIQVAPFASVDDGLFDILMVRDIGWIDTLRHMPKLYSGKPLRHPKIRWMRGRRVTATSPEEVLIDFDGEQPGMLPASFEVIPHGIRVQVPADTAG
jgi:YegS/Rv2252/BmrU family lipid kinase